MRFQFITQLVLARIIMLGAINCFCRLLTFFILPKIKDNTDNQHSKFVLKTCYTEQNKECIKLNKPLPMPLTDVAIV